MKAMVRKAFGGVEQLTMMTVPDPTPGNDDVLIRVRAFGINRAEIYMRQGVWGDVAEISGIECVGEVAHDPSGALDEGQRVAAIMGGMGRTRSGSYAEYTCVPRTNVIPLATDLDWAHLAAIPESYATAWYCLHDNLQLKSGDTVVIRGGTSALGQAAINIAAQVDGVRVIGTTRNPQHQDLLRRLGCVEVLLESPSLSGTLKANCPRGVDGVVDIIGNTTLLDSLAMVRKGGTVCYAGFLGGGDPISFNPLAHMPPGVNLNFFASFMFGTPDFPLDRVPLQTLVDRSAAGIYQNEPTRVFPFHALPQAQSWVAENRAIGKVVVRW